MPSLNGSSTKKRQKIFYNFMAYGKVNLYFDELTNVLFYDKCYDIDNWRNRVMKYSIN